MATPGVDATRRVLGQLILDLCRATPEIFRSNEPNFHTRTNTNGQMYRHMCATTNSNTSRNAKHAHRQVHAVYRRLRACSDFLVKKRSHSDFPHSLWRALGWSMKGYTGLLTVTGVNESRTQQLHLILPAEKFQVAHVSLCISISCIFAFVAMPMFTRGTSGILTVAPPLRDPCPAANRPPVSLQCSWINL